MQELPETRRGRPAERRLSRLAILLLLGRHGRGQVGDPEAAVPAGEQPNRLERLCLDQSVELSPSHSQCRRRLGGGQELQLVRDRRGNGLELVSRNQWKATTKPGRSGRYPWSVEQQSLTNEEMIAAVEKHGVTVTINSSKPGIGEVFFFPGVRPSREADLLEDDDGSGVGR